MIISERSYSGKMFRPRPEIFIDAGGDLLIVATPWGPRSSAKKAIQVIQDHIQAARSDQEATSPFSILTCLSLLGNHLRTAIKLANDIIYNEDNKNEYMAGIELFVLAKSNSEAVWAQVGMPMPLLDRPQRPLTSLGGVQDLALEFSLGPQLLAPLPTKLLGTDITSDFSTESFRLSHHDRILLISRSCLVPAALQLSPVDRTIDHFSKIFSEDDADLPFWLGLIDLKQ